MVSRFTPLIYPQRPSRLAVNYYNVSSFPLISKYLIGLVDLFYAFYAFRIAPIPTQCFRIL